MVQLSHYKSLQQPSEKLAHRGLVWLPVEFIQRQSPFAFVDGVRDREAKWHLLVGSDRSLNKAFNQVPELEAAKAAAGTSARLTMREVTRVPRGKRPPRAERRRNVQPVYWQCGNACHLSRGCLRRPGKVINNQDYVKDLQPEEEPT